MTQEKFRKSIDGEADTRCRENVCLLWIRAVALFIRHRAPPMGKIGGGADARGEDIANRTLGEEFFDEYGSRMEPPIASDHGNKVMSLNRGEERIDSLQ